MKELLFSEYVATAGAFATGCLAKKAGFKLLDDAREDDFDTLLFAHRNPPTPRSPITYAAFITCFAALYGAISYPAAIKSPNQAEPSDILKGALMGVTFSICFSAGAKLVEYRARCTQNERNLTRNRYTQV